MDKLLKRLCNAIMNGRFNPDRYCQRKSYYDVELQTGPLLASYGQIGYKVCVYKDDSHEHTLKYDWELKKLTIDDQPYKDAINLLYLEDNDVHTANDQPVWEKHPRSVELECYTDAGGDMLIHLEEPTKKKLQEYIDNFDINAEVLLWWQDGKPGNGVPFDNVMEHYRDYEDWLKWLQKVCNKMPY